MRKIYIHELQVNELADLICDKLEERIGGILNSREEEEYLTRKETAELLQISLVTLSEYCKRGIIPRSYRIGKNIRFKRSEIDKAVTKGLRYNLKREGGRS